jgi:hypothetical protein
MLASRSTLHRAGALQARRDAIEKLLLLAFTRRLRLRMPAVVIDAAHEQGQLGAKVRRQVQRQPVAPSVQHRAQCGMGPLPVRSQLGMISSSRMCVICSVPSNTSRPVELIPSSPPAVQSPCPGAVNVHPMSRFRRRGWSTRLENMAGPPAPQREGQISAEPSS